MKMFLLTLSLVSALIVTPHLPGVQSLSKLSSLPHSPATVQYDTDDDDDEDEGTTEEDEERYRIGAICNGGWESDATGRGACSHHGGVMCWKYSDGTCTKP